MLHFTSSDRVFQSTGSQTFLRVINWALPLLLFSIATGLELAEEFILEKFSWYTELHFALETVLFGIVGPVAVFFVLNYIHRLLEHEHSLMVDLEQLNQELERRVTERTTELEERNNELAYANQELQKLDEMKSEFVSLVSHELRAPLTILNGGLELTLQHTNTLPHAARRILETMVDESAHLMKLVQTILDVSRLETGKLEFNLGPVALRPLMEQAAEVILVSKNCCLEWEFDTNLPPVWADEIYLEEIIRNLMRNAEKYSPKGSPIHLCASRQEKYVRVSIKDHGIGISKELQQYIFERFSRIYQGESAPPGWGLGLYFARKLIEAQGGSIHVQSPINDNPDFPGTEFYLLIPVAEDSEE